MLRPGDPWQPRSEREPLQSHPRGSERQRGKAPKSYSEVQADQDLEALLASDSMVCRNRSFAQRCVVVCPRRVAARLPSTLRLPVASVSSSLPKYENPSASRSILAAAVAIGLGFGGPRSESTTLP
eukprot:2483657-Prymnesium_polylepis.2